MSRNRKVFNTPKSLLPDIKNDYSEAESQFNAMKGVFVDLGDEDRALTPRERGTRSIEKGALLKKFISRDPDVPQLAIIINVAGSPKAFPDVLRSLTRQSFVQRRPQRVEVILVQDGPNGIFDGPLKDEVLTALADFPSETKLQGFHLGRDKPEGRSTARNVGICHADPETKVLMFLDDAMILHEDFIAEQMVRHAYTQTPIALIGFKENRKYGNLTAYEDDLGTLMSTRPDFRKDWKWSRTLSENEVDKEFTYRQVNYTAGSNISYMRVTDNLKLIDGKTPVGFRALPMFFHTGITSVTYDAVLKVGGFEPLFDVDVWGFEDSYLGLLLSVNGVKLVPCPSSVAYKVEFEAEEDHSNKNAQIEYHRTTFWECADKKEMSSYNKNELTKQIDRLKKPGLLRSVSFTTEGQPSSSSQLPPPCKQFEFELIAKCDSNYTKAYLSVKNKGEAQEIRALITIVESHGFSRDLTGVAYPIPWRGVKKGRDVKLFPEEEGLLLISSVVKRQSGTSVLTLYGCSQDGGWEDPIDSLDFTDSIPRARLRLRLMSEKNYGEVEFSVTPHGVTLQRNILP